MITQLGTYSAPLFSQIERAAIIGARKKAPSCELGALVCFASVVETLAVELPSYTRRVLSYGT